MNNANVANALLQQDNFINIVSQISKELGYVKLTDDEFKRLVKFINKIDRDKIAKYSNQELSAVIVKCYVNKLKNTNKITESIAAQENIYNITQLFGVSDKKAIIRICNMPALYKYTYMVLSSKNSSPFADNVYKINWQLMENNTLSTNSVNITAIHDLVGIRLYPIKFTYISGIWDYQRHTLLINELLSQSILGYNNTRYHFILESYYTTYRTQYIEMLAQKENAYYWFNPPITTLKSITISMADYLNSISIPITYFLSYISFTNPISIAIDALSETFTTGQTCQFYNVGLLNPASPTNAAFISSLTRGTGWTITVIASISTYTRFTVPIDGTVISPADIPLVNAKLGNVASVYTYNYSIGTIIPICLISLK